MMNKPQWLTTKAVGAGAGNQHKLLPESQQFELTINLATVPGFRPFSHRDITDGKTLPLTAIYNDTGFGAYILIDTPYLALKERLT